MDTQLMDTQSATSRFESCGTFEAGEDNLVCACGWFEEDHGASEPSVTKVWALPLRTFQLPARRAS